MQCMDWCLDSAINPLLLRSVVPIVVFTQFFVGIVRVSQMSLVKKSFDCLLSFIVGALHRAVFPLCDG